MHTPTHTFPVIFNWLLAPCRVDNRSKPRPPAVGAADLSGTLGLAEYWGPFQPLGYQIRAFCFHSTTTF